MGVCLQQGVVVKGCVVDTLAPPPPQAETGTPILTSSGASATGSMHTTGMHSCISEDEEEINYDDTYCSALEDFQSEPNINIGFDRRLFRQQKIKCIVKNYHTPFPTRLYCSNFQFWLMFPAAVFTRTCIMEVEDKIEVYYFHD